MNVSQGEWAHKNEQQTFRWGNSNGLCELLRQQSVVTGVQHVGLSYII